MAVLSALEFLHRIFDVYKGYFGNVTARTITEHFATAFQVSHLKGSPFTISWLLRLLLRGPVITLLEIYRSSHPFQLLEEMLDNGYPMISEPNALNTFIAPPSVMAAIAKFTTGKSSTVGSTIQDATMSVIPWRRNGVSYTNNEINLEISEVIDCIVESNGTVVANDLKGYIHANSKLSGTPDLILYFTNPNILDDVSFHPCVRYARFEREKIVSFVPPDGNFLLMTYSTVDKNITVPIYCRPSVTHREGVSNVSFVLGTRPISSRNTNIMSITSSGGISSHSQQAPSDVQVEQIVVTITFPKIYKTINLTPNVGKIFVDINTNVVTWNVGKFPGNTTPELQGTAYLESGVSTPIESIHATLKFTVPNTNASGLSIRDLQLTRETYKFFKGLKTSVRAGRYQIRT